MNLEPTPMNFNSEEIENSNGIYGLIIKTALEQNKLTLDDLKPLYMNRVEGAKISGWFSFSQTMVRVLEKGSDMTFSSFLKWAKMLDLKVAAQAISYYGYELPEDEQAFLDLTAHTEVSELNSINIDEDDIKEMELMDVGLTTDLEFDEDSMDDDMEEDLERIQKFLDYSLELAAFAVESKQDNQEVVEFLLNKLQEGFDILDVEEEVDIISVAGAVEEAYMFFTVTVMVNKEKPVVSTYTKKLY
jgi:hypothetical protein